MVVDQKQKLFWNQGTKWNILKPCRSWKSNFHQNRNSSIGLVTLMATMGNILKHLEQHWTTWMATLANRQHRTTVWPPSPKIQPVELSNSNRPPFPFNEILSLSHSIKTLTYHVPPAIIYDIVMMQCILCTAFIFDKYFWNVSTKKVGKVDRWWYAPPSH